MEEIVTIEVIEELLQQIIENQGSGQISEETMQSIDAHLESIDNSLTSINDMMLPVMFCVVWAVFTKPWRRIIDKIKEMGRRL